MHLLQNLQASESAICQIWSALVERNNEGKDITKLIMDYTREAKTRDSLLKILINAYKSEISRLKMEGSHDQLSKRQKSTIREEMKVLERLCDTNIRDGSSQEAYDSVSPHLFKEFTEEVQERCPLIHEVIETLVISNQQERNVYKTNSHKILQSLAFMVNIRNSKARNSFPLLFGLLCVSYGAGKQFTDTLQSMGLSVHWNTM